MTDNGERVNPSVLEVGLLYKMFKKLESIEETLKTQVPMGKIVNIPDGISLTAGDTYVDFIKGLVVYPNNTKKSIPTFRTKLFSISIENEGADDCIITINPDETWGKRIINSGETYELDMKKAVIMGLKLSVAAEKSCTVQISGVV